ncbi:MAG: hypothetical protein H7Y86_02370 [Rhizobacter sp.]|nr:hypothetical protein [Ferruginibacter sp.]
MTDLTKFIISTILFCNFLASCTMKAPCDNGNIKLGFVSFSDTVTDSFILRQFKKSTNFKTPVDTILITRTNGSYKKSNDSLQVEYSFNLKHGYTSSNYGLTSEYDYEVYLPTINFTFQISDIVEEYKSQNKGLTSDTSTCANVIKSYKINREAIYGELANLTIYLHR